MRSDEEDADNRLSNSLEARVALKSQVPQGAELEEYWPDIENLAHREAVTNEAMSPDTFFDCGPVHLISTATLKTLAAQSPEARFEIRRLSSQSPDRNRRPRVRRELLIGQTISIGNEVRLLITGNTLRCVMTTLAQNGLPKDLGILRTAVQANGGSVGVYASVSSSGVIRNGDQIVVE